jgi:hypothetical protein
MTLLDAYAWVQRRYGEDVAQETMQHTLARQQGPAYVVALGRRLGHGGYADWRGSLSHWHTWGREAVREIIGGQPLWTSVEGTPERKAIAREALREVPWWLIEWHVTEGITTRLRCRAHAVRWWYPYRDRRGVPGVRCRRCLAAKARRKGVTR